MRDEILRLLESDPWRWWSYNDVARAIGQPRQFAVVHQALLALARDGSSKVVGRKVGPSRRFAHDQFRAAPSNTVEIGEAKKATRLLKTGSWLYAYIRDHPGTSSNKTIAAVTTFLGIRLHRQEGLAVIKMLVEHGLVHRDETGLSAAEDQGRTKEFKAAIVAWYEANRISPNGPYLVPKPAQSGSTGGSSCRTS